MNYNNGDSAKHWTTLSKECLQRGCNCKGCFYDEFFKRSRTEGSLAYCRMKFSIRKLIKRFGLPEGIEQPTIIESEAENE